MKDKVKRPPRNWKHKILFVLAFVTLILLVAILLLHHSLIKKNCRSRNINIEYPLTEIAEPIASDNIQNLTNLMSYPYIGLSWTEGSGVFGAFLSEDNRMLIVTGYPFTYETQTLHTGKTTATWELNKDKDDKPFCYLYVGHMGSINREAIAISPDNRFVLIEQDYHQANCEDLACIFVYDREHNVEIPYLEFNQYAFEVELNHYGYIHKKIPHTPFCLDDFENPKLFQFLSHQLDAEKECIRSIILSSNDNFVVVLLAVKADGYYQFGRIEIWGIVD